MQFICHMFFTAATAIYQQGAYSVNEDGGEVEVCVALVAATSGTLNTDSTVTITFEDDSASMSRL